MDALALKWARGEPIKCSSAPSAEWGDKMHIIDCLRGGPAVVRPLLFLPGWSGGLLRCRIQGGLGPGSAVPSMTSILQIIRRSRRRSGWHWLSCLLSLRRFRATGSSRRAGAFQEEVLYRLRRLLSLREAFRKALHSWSKQAAWRDWSVEEGNLVRLFHLHHREPEVAFQHYQAGHWSLMAWAVALVAHRARSIGLLRSLSEAASRPASLLASILAWKTWSTSIECSAKAACPAAE